ncbi:hypothetical protein [Asanoa sp. NPDC050611]|uniref:hypothetical protein n=1 Tax=Asanoa sp. NPDC050611 TaxID=3157098 RepID=UPI0033F3E910
MSRVAALDLTLPSYGWRDVPMPGANAPLALTRLDSRPGTLALHGRFPAGFHRPVAGGYVVAEEFLVLDGTLEIGGAVFRRGDLTYVPPGYVRAGMRSVGGCTVLAWFGGPAEFREAHLLPVAVRGLVTVAFGEELDLPAGRWCRGGAVPPGATGDVVTADLSAWRRLDGSPVVRNAVVRVEKP